MMLTIYESVHAMANIYKQTPDSVASQLGLVSATISMTNPPANPSMMVFLTEAGMKAMVISKNTFAQKFKLVDDKKKALTNISNKTAQMSDSTTTVLNNAFETARRAFEFRLNLELSVLNSQLKSVDIEIAKIKLMSADEFTAKYGV